MNYYIEVLKKYAVFSGRSRRSEYWYFVLFNILISIALGVVDVALGMVNEFGGLLGTLYSLAVLLPGLGVSIRRLHDTGRSGWWLLLLFIPLIGALVIIIFMAQDSNPGSNDYGPSPK